MTDKIRILVKLRQARDSAFAARRFGAAGFALTPLFEVPAPATVGMAAARADRHRWYLAELDGGGNPWDQAHGAIATRFGAVAGLGETLAVEPDLDQQWFPDPPSGALPLAATGCVFEDQNPGLPMGDGFAWHLKPDRSQLKKARDSVMQGGEEVVIAHIDTGYDPNHGTLPENLDTARQRNFIDKDRKNDASDRTPTGGILRNRGHGTGTLSLLAGNVLKNMQAPADNGDYLGGAPKAKIIPIRAANSVVQFSTSSIAQAFNYAHEIGVDVVSMSLGGLPSLAWTDAINAAYNAGIVMVCAAGNNYSALPTRFIVYPARYRRVIAACGVMANGLPYYNLLIDQMQGNYGPSSKMATAMSAYTPNTPWAKFKCEKIVNMDGAGTSAATPQIAAAAALWLRKYKKQIAGMKPWARVEAVRRALFTAAAKSAPDMSPEEVYEMLGNGTLRGEDALRQQPATEQQLARTPEDSASFAFLRLLLGFGVAGDDPHARMLELEMTQLALGSHALEQAVPDPDARPDAITDREQRRFIETILDEGRCSVALRRYLERRIGRHSAAAAQPALAMDAAASLEPGVVAGTTAQATPPHRRLRIFALDPSFGAELDTTAIGEVTVGVPWEATRSNMNLLMPGPVGQYLEVIDVDPASDCCYAPVDLNDPFLLAQDGLCPSEGNPQFHQQMAYAVAMLTIRRFEIALGRSALWAARRMVRTDKKTGKDKITEVYIPRLRIYPHALRERNAYYSPERSALLFGYFPAAIDADGVAGSMVFTCLSHDIVAHETTHALLDGLHRRFQDGSNPDVFAFHEAFADIVALFQHFTYPEILRHALQQTRGRLTSSDLLADMARQFGKGIGRSAALRSAIRVDPKYFNYAETMEPHDRGAILVAAVFDAFLAIYNRRVEDLLRLASDGTGILRPGALHPDLIERLADEAAKTASQMLNICIRALDYAPPVDITFGDYLRALITADADLVPDDPYGYRVAFLEAFRKRGITVDFVRTYSVESMRWREPRVQPNGLAGIIGRLDLGWDVNAERYEAYQAARANCARIHEWIKNGKASPQTIEEFGLTDIKREPFEVHSVRPARRVAPDGSFRTDLIVVITQRKEVPLDPKQLALGNFRFRGGCTLVIDTRKGFERIRYSIVKRINNMRRLDDQRRFILEDSPLSLSSLYFGNAEEREPFRVLHQGH